MPIEVTARHMSATSEIQEYAKDKAGELLEVYPRIENIHVILNVERHLSIAETVIQAPNHVKVEAVGSSDDMMASIDMAVDKAEKQLRKILDKVHDHKPDMKRVEASRIKGE
jgi:putative sigma-54 modulation protein